MKKKRYLITVKSASIVLAFSVTISSAFGFAGGMAAADYHSSMRPTAVATQLSSGTEANFMPAFETVSTNSGSGSKLSAADVASVTANSVVEITTESVTTDSWMQQYITNGAGSGVIITQDGYVITNNHVINGASKITVRLKNGTTYSASLVGTDKKTDVALLKIKATGLTPAIFGDSDSLKVGDTAIAIGNPLGQLGGTVTEGIISALDRELVIDGKTMTLLQTDAAINPGNSGGGLFNDKGELVGVVVAKSAGSGVEGLGFAIPVNNAKTVANQLMQYGYVKGRIDTGMTFIDLTSAPKAFMYGVSNLGVYIQSVKSGSNAAKAGFQAGDMIAYVGDTKITGETALTQALDRYKVGDTAAFTIIRSGRSSTLSLVVGEYKPD